MTPVRRHSQPTPCAYKGLWRGGAALPLRTPGAARPCRASGRVAQAPNPLAIPRCWASAAGRGSAAACSPAGRSRWPPSRVRGRCWAGHVASGRGGAVLPLAGALTVLPLLSFLRADCRRAATHAPHADYGALLTKDQPVAEGRLTKAALVEEVADAADLTKKHAEVIVETVLGGIVDALQRGEKVELRGFGSFRFRRRLPRKGRNPKTGDRVDVPSKRVPYFKPGKELKELINREQTQAVPPPLSD